MNLQRVENKIPCSLEGPGESPREEAPVPEEIPTDHVTDHVIETPEVTAPQIDEVSTEFDIKLEETIEGTVCQHSVATCMLS